MVKIDSEKLIERRLADRVKKSGGLCLKLATLHVMGLPDRLCLLPGGRAIFVELKTTGQKPKKIQICMHSRLKAIGFEVHVIDTIESVDELIEYANR